MNIINIALHYDLETNVYIVSSDDIPGLVMEHDNLYALMYLTCIVSQEMLDVNKIDTKITSDTIFEFVLEVKDFWTDMNRTKSQLGDNKDPAIEKIVNNDITIKQIDGKMVFAISIPYLEAEKNKEWTYNKRKQRIEDFRNS